MEATIVSGGKLWEFNVTPPSARSLQRHFVASTWACVHATVVNFAPGVQAPLPD
jgi:hypothetical protein